MPQTPLDEVFVAGAVSHAYSLHPSNYAIEGYAEPVMDLMLGAEEAMPDEYQRTEESFLTDWGPEVTANAPFRGWGTVKRAVVAYAVLFFVVSPLLFFPANPSSGGSVVNVVTHFGGFFVGYVATGVAVYADSHFGHE